MNATMMLNERHIIAENAFVEMVVWHLPSPISGSRHGYKYRLALVVGGSCVLRYDTRQEKVITSIWAKNKPLTFSPHHKPS